VLGNLLESRYANVELGGDLRLFFVVALDAAESNPVQIGENSISSF
jgi:hypothetical protein